jgi:hypothetical protein
MANTAGDQVPKTKRDSMSTFALHLLIYAVCDAAWALVLAPLVPGSLSEMYATLFVEGYAGVAVLLAFFTSRELKPKKLRTVWIIGAVGPIAVLVVFFVLLFSKR